MHIPHETKLIAILALGFVFAFAGGLLAQRLRLPPLVGYLLAGVAVGPYTPGFVGDMDLAGEIAEVGVILLMFGVGLHFSLSDLMSVRKIAVPGAVVQIGVATAIGIAIANFWGWSFGGGLVLGLSLSVASTVVLLRALEERGSLNSENGRIAVGWLIVEDLVMVLALVLLPALAGPLGGKIAGAAAAAAQAGAAATAGAVVNAVGDALGAGAQNAAAAVQHSSSGSIAITIGITLVKVGAFVAVMLIAGRRVVPWLLSRAARTGSRELFTLAVLATALGIAYGSSALFGVSFALGAFFAGIVLNETDFSHQAAADSLPLQDAFAVLFFVSVGMLFDPSILIRQPLEVIAVLAVIMFGKSVAAYGIVRLFGLPNSTALNVAAALAQIGEFSFILASLGIALGLMPKTGRDLILAGALLSITLNPLMFVLANWLTKRLGDNEAPPEPVLNAAGEGPTGHAVIVGFGRVGGAIGRALDAWDLPYVVVERDRRRADEVRARGQSVVFGDAAAPGILAAAGIHSAKLLIAASPNGYQSLRAFEIAREANPEIDTLVRTHSESEHDWLERAHVGMAVAAEQEVALGMMGYALRSLGLSEGEVRMFVQSARTFDDAGLRQGRPEEPPPELRRHREPGDGK